MCGPWVPPTSHYHHHHHNYQLPPQKTKKKKGEKRGVGGESVPSSGLFKLSALCWIRDRVAPDSACAMLCRRACDRVLLIGHRAAYGARGLRRHHGDHHGPAPADCRCAGSAKPSRRDRWLAGRARQTRFRFDRGAGVDIRRGTRAQYCGLTGWKSTPNAVRVQVQILPRRRCQAWYPGPMLWG